MEVFLGGGKRDDDEEEEDDDEDEDGDDYDERGKEKGRREMERERERTRGWMNVRTWFRGWCVKILDAGVEVESLEVRVFGAGLGGVGLSEGEVGMDLLAPVREVRAKKCVVEIGEGEGKVGEEERRYGDRVAELVMGREGEIGEFFR